MYTMQCLPAMVIIGDRIACVHGGLTADFIDDSRWSHPLDCISSVPRPYRLFQPSSERNTHTYMHRHNARLCSCCIRVWYDYIYISQIVIVLIMCYGAAL